MQPRPIVGSRRLCGPELLLGVVRGAVVLFIEQQDVAVGLLVPRIRKPLALAVTAGAEGLRKDRDAAGHRLLPPTPQQRPRRSSRIPAAPWVLKDVEARSCASPYVKRKPPYWSSLKPGGLFVPKKLRG